MYEEGIPDRDYYGAFNLRISPEGLTYSRLVYSFIECIGDIGGLLDFILKGGVFFTSGIVGNMYLGALVKNVFQI